MFQEENKSPVQEKEYVSITEAAEINNVTRQAIYVAIKLIDNNKGYYSVKQAAEMLGVPVQKIYYSTRVGRLQAHRKGSAWVIHIDDINRFRENQGASSETA